MKRKLVVILFLGIAFTGLASAQSFSVGDSTVTYSSSFTPDITCSGGSCPPSVDMNVCGTSRTLSLSSGRYGSSTSFFVPLAIPCGYGENALVVQDSGTETVLGTGTLTVEAKNMPNKPHRGKFLFGEVDVNKEKLRDFVLTNDGQTFFNRWGFSTPSGDGPYLLLQETDWIGLAGAGDGPDDPGWYEVEKGSLIESGGSLSSVTVEDSNTKPDHSGISADSLGSDDVLNEPFQTAFDLEPGGKEGCDTDVDIFSNCTPVHEADSYNLEGPVIAGHVPEHYYDLPALGITKAGGGDPHFFICRKGARMQTGFGGETGQVVDVSKKSESQDLRKCVNTGGSSYEWQPVAECEDGLDNDGDGTVDHSSSPYTISGVSTDPDCGSPTDTESVSTCQPLVGGDPGGLDPDDNRIAYYNPGTGAGSVSPPGTSCWYHDTEIDPTTSASPLIFKCHQDGTVTDHPPARIVAAQSACGDVPDSAFSSHGDPIAMAEYFVPEEYMPSISDGASVSEASKYVDSSGYDYVKYQTLHEAEQRYADSTFTTFPGGSTGYLPPLHSTNAYDPLNMTELGDGYNYAGDGNGAFGTTYSDYLDSWTVANASGEAHDKINSDPGTLANKRVFPGGFAGRCPPGQVWRYVDNPTFTGWKCSGSLAWKPPYFVPDLMVTGGSTNLKTGIFFNQSVFEENTLTETPGSFADAWDDQKPTTATIEEIRYDCYPGPKSSETPGSTTSWITYSVPSTPAGSSNPFSKTVFLPDTVNVAGVSQYSCKFEFKIEKSTGTTQWAKNLGGDNEITDDNRAISDLSLGSYFHTTFLDKPNQADSNLNGP